MTPKPLPRLAKWTGAPEFMLNPRMLGINAVISYGDRCEFFSELDNVWFESAYSREDYYRSGWQRIAVLKPTPTGR